jgi:hypothetical protein
MNGRKTFQKQIHTMKRQAVEKKRPITEFRIGRWILRENDEGSLEAFNFETGATILIGEA